jgi:hypothetical protein
MFVRAWAGYMVVNMVGRLYGMIPYKDLPTHSVWGGRGKSSPPSPSLMWVTGISL